MIDILISIGVILLVSIVLVIIFAVFLGIQVFLCNAINSDDQIPEEMFYPDRPENYGDQMYM